MNIIDIQDNLKNLPEQALMQEMQRPTGSAPQFLVLGELKRRKQMREDYNRQKNADMKTVAEEVVTAAGAPQEGIMQMARSLNPNTNMAQDTGLAQATPVTPTQAPQPQAPQMMSDGGIMRLQTGGYPDDLSRSVGSAINYNRSNQGRGVNTPNANVIDAYLRGELDPSSKAYRDMVTFEQLNGRDKLREISSQIVNPFGQSPYYSSRDEITPRMSQEDAMATRRRLAGGAGIGSVSADAEDFSATSNVDSGFGSNIEYTYNTFLEENSLNDSPQAREMFSNYKSYMDTREPPSNPQLFSAMNFDEGPQGLASVAPQTADFMPNSGEFTRPELSLSPQILNELSVEPDAAFTRQTSPAEPMSTLDQLRSSVYSNNPLENALAGTGLDSNVIGTSVIDPIRNRIDEAVSREGMPSQTAADIANETALRNREMASENAGRLTAEELLSGSSIAEAAPTTVQDIINARSAADNQGGPMGEAAVAPEPLSYDDLVAKAQAGSPVTESDLVASVEAGLLNDNQAADINAMLDDPNYIPSAQEQRISNLERTNRMPPSGPTNPDLLGPRVFRGIGDYAAGVFGGRTIGEQDAIDAERAEETAAFAQANALEVPVGSMVEQESTTTQGDAAQRAADSMMGTGITSIGGRGAAPTTPVAGTTTGTTPATTKDTGDAGFGSMDSRIAQMLSNRQKEAESDKWMALAQTGMALMASKNPTLGGALGEAGLAGVGALQKSKQGARAFETDMLKLQTQLDIARQRARSSKSSKNIPATALNSAQADVESAQTRLLEARTDAERLSASRALKIAQGRYNQLTRMFDTQHGVPISNANGVGGTKNINLTGT